MKCAIIIMSVAFLKRYRLRFLIIQLIGGMYIAEELITGKP